MTRKNGDISAALAYQLKKEIAENYFGTRKNLEEERETLLGRRVELNEAWEKEILPLLTNIFKLLVGNEAGKSFLELIGKKDLTEPMLQILNRQGKVPTPASCSIPFALTAKKKYKNLISSLYRQARGKEEELFKEFNSLLKKSRLFNEDLGKFNACYSLPEILSLTKSIEESDGLKGSLGENTDPLAVPLLEEKLLLRPLDLSREPVYFQHPLPPLEAIRKPLEELIDQTYQNHCSVIKENLKGLLS